MKVISLFFLCGFDRQIGIMTRAFLLRVRLLSPCRLLLNGSGCRFIGSGSCSFLLFTGEENSTLMLGMGGGGERIGLLATLLMDWGLANLFRSIIVMVLSLCA